MIDIRLDCGWQIAGTTDRPRGLQVLDADGELVKGIKSVDIHLDHTGFPEIRVSMYPRLEEGGSDVGAVMDNSTNDEG